MEIRAASAEGEDQRSEILLGEDDLKEIFALFCSTTEFERAQIYRPGGPHFFKEIDLDGAYSYTADRREFALDAWRAVVAFLQSRGLRIARPGGDGDPGPIDPGFLP